MHLDYKSLQQQCKMLSVCSQSWQFKLQSPVTKFCKEEFWKYFLYFQLCIYYLHFLSSSKASALAFLTMGNCAWQEEEWKQNSHKARKEQNPSKLLVKVLKCGIYAT